MGLDGVVPLVSLEMLKPSAAPFLLLLEIIANVLDIAVHVHLALAEKFFLKLASKLARKTKTTSFMILLLLVQDTASPELDLAVRRARRPTFARARRRRPARAACANMERLPRFLQLHCFSFLGCEDVARAMAASKEALYLLAGLERQAAGIEVESAAKEDEVDAAMSKALRKLSARPQFAVVFYKGAARRKKIAAFAEKRLPADVPVLAAEVADVQSCAGGTAQPNTDAHMVVEMGAFPEATCTAFGADLAQDQPVDLGAVVAASLDASREASFWKVFVVLASGGLAFARTPDLLRHLQTTFPHATVLGGISQSVAVFKGASAERLFARSGVAVLAFGGNVPLRTCVSLGLVPTTPLVDIVEAAWVPDSSGNLEINKIRYGETEMRGAIWANQVGNGTIAIKLPGQAGYQLSDDAGLEIGPDGLPQLVVTMENVPPDTPLHGAKMGTFVATADAAVDDLKAMLDRLQAHLTRNDEEVLAGIMFSCSARGPQAMTPATQPMFDACAFQERFHVPLVGFYAGGEIGPRARGLVDGDPFETSHAVVQGYTVVFGVFIVPKRTGSPLELYGNDSASTDARIADFLAGRKPLHA